MSRALAAGATGPEAFTLLLRLVSNHFDGTDTGASYTKLHHFGAPNGTPFCDFSRAFRGVVSAATGTERVLAPGGEIFLEMVRMAVNEQCPSLMPTLYPGVLATVSRPFGTLDAMWLAFETLVKNKTPAINGEKTIILPASSTGVRSSAPSRPRPASNGPGQGRTLPQSPAWQTGSHNNKLVMNVNKSTPDPWLDASSNCWVPEEHHYAEVHAVCVSVQTDDPPLWSGLLSSPVRAADLSENRGHCLNLHEDSHSLRQCRHPFRNPSNILDPDLGTLVNDGEAFRRWQERMIGHRRENNSRSNTHNQKEHKRRFGHLRGQHHPQVQQNRQSDDYDAHAERGHQQSNSGHLAFPPQLPPWGFATVLRITRTETQTNVSQAPSAPVTERSTAVRLLLPVRRQHFSEKNIDFTRCSRRRLAQRSALTYSAPSPLVAPYFGPTQRISPTSSTRDPPGVYPDVGIPRLKRRPLQPGHESRRVKRRSSEPRTT